MVIVTSFLKNASAVTSQARGDALSNNIATADSLRSSLTDAASA